MATKMSQSISASTYAKTLGVSFQTVQGYIRRGKLTMGIGLRKPKKKNGHVTINLIEGSQELLENMDFVRSQNGDEIKKRLCILAGIKEPEPEHKPEKPVDLSKPIEELSLNEAKRRHEIAKAKIAELKLLETEKTLVNAEEIKKKLYDYGVEIRQAIEGVPGKVIDDVLAAETRFEAMMIMKAAIDEALQKIYDIQKRKL